MISIALFERCLCDDFLRVIGRRYELAVLMIYSKAKAKVFPEQKDERHCSNVVNIPLSSIVKIGDKKFHGYSLAQGFCMNTRQKFRQDF